MAERGKRTRWSQANMGPDSFASGFAAATLLFAGRYSDYACMRDEWLSVREQKPCLNNREQNMVVIRRDDAGKPTVWCDPCIADLVAALNDGGFPTIASCCGHGVRPGNIALEDGRELIIAPDYDTARRIDGLFPALPGNEFAPLRQKEAEG